MRSGEEETLTDTCVPLCCIPKTVSSEYDLRHRV